MGATCLTRVVETDEFARWCRCCGCEAAPRDSVSRRLAHEPLGVAPDDVADHDRPLSLAINGRLEHLRGSDLGFRNLTNYIARSLLETGGFRPRLHPRS
jgi:hypothetical protein